MPRQLPTYWRASQAAEFLNVDPKTVSKWAREGKLPGHRTLGGHWRFNPDEIRRIADQLRHEPTAGPLAVSS